MKLRSLVRHFGVSKDKITEAITFLKDKGVLAHEVPEAAQARFACLANPAMAKDPVTVKHYEGAQARLLRLGIDGETHSSELPPNVQRWDSGKFPGYKESDVVFMRNPGSLAQRAQKSGLCYMQAPATVQHYALVHNGKPPKMLDLVKFVRTHFDAEKLEKHVFEDKGGDSISFLQGILEPNSQLAATNDMDRVPDYINKYGAGLISRFQVHEDFNDSNLSHHHGTPVGKKLGPHAMAVVGHRVTEDGQKMFLCQNWWSRKQFVEVDGEYLKKCGAVLNFVETPQSEIPKSFSSDNFFYHECEMLDKGEAYWGECEW